MTLLKAERPDGSYMTEHVTAENLAVYSQRLVSGFDAEHQDVLAEMTWTCVESIDG